MDNAFPWLQDLQFSPENDALILQFYTKLEATIDQHQVTQLSELFTSSPKRLKQFHHVVNTSIYAQEQLLRRPSYLIPLINDIDNANIDHTTQLSHLKHLSPDKFDQELRLYRIKAMLHLIWRDFNRLNDVNQTTDDISNLAKSAINLCVDYHYGLLCQKYGTPRNDDGKAQPLVVLGMGKLGADELNLSSDIDLIFAYPEKGQTDSQAHSLSNQEFFIRLGKQVIQSLDANTAEGFVFRVDMRLRPYGQSGALVYSYDALLEYYQTQGREWERYAMIKADVIANSGDTGYSKQLKTMLRQFTYRRYVDFSVIEALRKLKQMITQEVKRRRLDDDIKLGAGGIREVEFIAQVFQLIRGGRDRELQNNRILNILPLLSSLNCLPQPTVNALIEAYIFLRNCEHGIQGYNDEQTQKLPTQANAQRALASIMGFSDWSTFLSVLNKHRAIVQEAFGNIIASPNEQEDTEEPSPFGQALWQNHSDKDCVLAELEQHGHNNAPQSLMLVDELRLWTKQSAMHTTSRERLDTFVPILLNRLSDFSTPTDILFRLIPLIKAIARRSAYLLLLMENPSALSRLLKLSEASPWIADEMANTPALLDELLDPTSLYRPPEKAELESELRKTMLRIPQDDLEAQMDTLRYFRSSHALRVACSEASDALPLMKVSDYLTDLAEVILDFVLQLSWATMTERHGYPDGKTREHPNFTIIGYGKLGGIELGHSSDLDLVFLYDASRNGSTNGGRPIENQVFYTRLGQKIIHFLTANMASGALYEVDMRLRPSGNSGMLVSSIESFEKYQKESAWTWEHQALVRARCICGDQNLATRFQQIRLQVLSKPRDLATLREDVIAMRHKMRSHLGSGNENEDFNLKHDAGGIVDIEFMVQYSVLAWTHSNGDLANFTDNIRILESLGTASLLDTQEVDQLINAYKVFRSAGHRLTLQQKPSIMGADDLVHERRAVIQIWQNVMGKDTNPTPNSTE